MSAKSAGSGSNVSLLASDNSNLRMLYELSSTESLNLSEGNKDKSHITAEPGSQATEPGLVLLIVLSLFFLSVFLGCWCHRSNLGWRFSGLSHPSVQPKF